ncbi:MAG: hypothetical protein ACJASO_001942, partial [Cyclobacteriaceae bacterium]
LIPDLLLAEIKELLYKQKISFLKEDMHFVNRGYSF